MFGTDQTSVISTVDASDFSIKNCASRRQIGHELRRREQSTACIILITKKTPSKLMCEQRGASCSRHRSFPNVQLSIDLCLVMKFFILASFLATLTSAAHLQNYIVSDDFINEINAKAKTWTAGRNFHPETSSNFLKGLMGLHPDHKFYMPEVSSKNYKFFPI